MIDKILLFLVAIIPEIIIGYCIYKMDKDKEPFLLLILLIIGGILSCFLVLFITYYLGLLFPIFNKPLEVLSLKEMLIYSFICVSLIEELCKFIFLYLISYYQKEFNYTFDMIVYGVFLSLGFAAFENVYSVFYNGLKVGLLRAITAIPLHACTGAFMGIFLSIAKRNEKEKKKNAYKYKIAALLVPVILHGIYDYCSFTVVLNALITVIIMFSTVTILNVNIHKKFNKKLN